MSREVAERVKPFGSYFKLNHCRCVRGQAGDQASAARQSWDRESDGPRRNPGFDIRPRKGYWPKDGGPWVTDPGRPADVYVFAWHGKTDEQADHRDATQWRFFVVAERLLPTGQKSVGSNRLKRIADPCCVGELARAVEDACPVHENLKAVRGRTVAGS